MSYYTIHRIPGTTVQFPASTAILQDMVVSSRDLDQMERTLETNQPAQAIQEIPNKLEHVIAIYNENIGNINSKCANFKREFKFWQYPTFEFYCAYNRESQSDPNARETYQKKTDIAKQTHTDELNEIYQLASIGVLHDSLKIKIERVTQRSMARSMALNLPVKEHPQLTGLWPRVYDYMLVVPTLRQLDEGATKALSSARGVSTSSSSTITTTTMTNTWPSTLTVTSTPATPQQEATPPVAISADSAPDLADTLAVALESPLNIQQPAETQKTEEVAPPQPAPAPTSVTAHIFMNLDLYNGNSIGICHEPNWGTQPVAFARGTTDGTWQGEIPIGKEYKFVIVQSNGTVLKWENLPFNRRVETGSPLEIQFPNNDADFS